MKKIPLLWHLIYCSLITVLSYICFVLNNQIQNEYKSSLYLTNQNNQILQDAFDDLTEKTLEWARWDDSTSIIVEKNTEDMRSEFSDNLFLIEEEIKAFASICGGFDPTSLNRVLKNDNNYYLSFKYFDKNRIKNIENSLNKIQQELLKKLNFIRDENSKNELVKYRQEQQILLNRLKFSSPQGAQILLEKIKNLVSIEQFYTLNLLYQRVKPDIYDPKLAFGFFTNQLNFYENEQVLFNFYPVVIDSKKIDRALHFYVDGKEIPKDNYSAIYKSKAKKIGKNTLKVKIIYRNELTGVEESSTRNVTFYVHSKCAKDCK